MFRHVNFVIPFMQRNRHENPIAKLMPFMEDIVDINDHSMVKVRFNACDWVWWLWISSRFQPGGFGRLRLEHGCHRIVCRCHIKTDWRLNDNVNYLPWLIVSEETSTNAYAIHRATDKFGTWRTIVGSIELNQRRVVNGAGGCDESTLNLRSICWLVCLNGIRCYVLLWLLTSLTLTTNPVSYTYTLAIRVIKEVDFECKQSMCQGEKDKECFNLNHAVVPRDVVSFKQFGDGRLTASSSLTWLQFDHPWDAYLYISAERGFALTAAWKWHILLNAQTRSSTAIQCESASMQVHDCEAQSQQRHFCNLKATSMPVRCYEVRGRQW